MICSTAVQSIMQGRPATQKSLLIWTKPWFLGEQSLRCDKLNIYTLCFPFLLVLLSSCRFEQESINVTEDGQLCIRPRDSARGCDGREMSRDLLTIPTMALLLATACVGSSLGTVRWGCCMLGPAGLARTTTMGWMSSFAAETQQGRTRPSKNLHGADRCAGRRRVPCAYLVRRGTTPSTSTDGRQRPAASGELAEGTLSRDEGSWGLPARQAGGSRLGSTRTRARARAASTRRRRTTSW